ncbi:MAG TPA: hypothetical protein VMU60_02415, partial [Syntrophobacteria bacterium]|nr:hypothetical protein [Syntrophobacteria bacterium]
MAEKILGIDLGTSAIKAVQVSRTLKASHVTGYASARVPAGSEPAQVVQILKEFIAQHNLE